MRRRLAPLLLPVLLAAAALTGCASDAEDEPRSGAPASTDSATAPSTSPSTGTSTGAGPEPTTTVPTATPTPTTSPTLAPSAPATTPATTPAAPATSAAPQPPAVDTDLRVAVTAYHVAFTTGDAPAAFELLSERCKDRVDMGAFGEDSLAQADLHGTTPRLTSYDAETGGATDADRAEVSATFRGPRIEVRDEVWIRELGAWHRDLC